MCCDNNTTYFSSSSAAYDQCNAVMKDYISSLDEGAILTHRKGVNKLGAGKLASLGIPLSVEILVEVICFGYCSANRKVSATLYKQLTIVIITSEYCYPTCSSIYYSVEHKLFWRDCCCSIDF